MAQEQLPLALKRVIERILFRHLLPPVEEVDRLRDVGVPSRTGCAAVMLNPAIAQTGHGGSLRSVYLNGEKVVSPHPHRPRGVEVRDDAALQLERGVRRIVGSALVWLSALVAPLRYMRRTQARHRLNLAEKVIEHITPMAQHVDDDAAAIFLAIVPRRPLTRYGVPFEHPVPEFTTNGKHPAEEAEIS